jgi:16S rRNA G966 N2-methylase RsmD
MELKIDAEFKNLVPPLQQEEYDLLEKSILEEGCRDALVIWNGFIIDGHNRYRICSKHNIEFDVVEKEFDSREKVKDWIDANQLGRRNLTPDQRQVLIGRRYNREKNKNKFKGNQYSGEGKNFTNQNTADKLSKEYNVSDRTIKNYATVADFYEQLEKEKPELAKEVWSGKANLKDVKRKQREEEIHKQRSEIAKSAENIKPSEKWNVWQADINTWQPPRQYDYIITDPPYPKEYLNLYETLAIKANDWLKDGGLLIAMCGQSYLNQIYEMMSKHITYYWTACYLTPGQPKPLRQVNVNTTWKPLLMFRKGQYKGRIFNDVFKSDGNDKSLHKWGQSESGMSDIISKVCLVGSWVADPFCGAGTTGVSALRNGCLFHGIDTDEQNIKITRRRLYDTTKR